MAKPTVRSAIVGCGFSGSFHYEAIQRVYGTNVEFMGVYDASREHREAYAAERGIRAYETLDALLAEVDLVHVCTTATAHEAVAIQVLDRKSVV